MRRLKYTALHRAVLDCRVAQVRILIEQCGADVDSRDLYGRTPLMLCCAVDNQRAAMAMARLVLAAEPDLAVKDDLGRTALAHACLFGREALVAHLAESRVIDPTEPDNDGCAPLHHAAVQGNSRVVCLLVRACAEGRSNVDCRNRLGATPLMLACRLRRYHCALFLLLDGGASGFVKDNAHFLSAMEWLRAAERQPLPSLHQPAPGMPSLRRAATAPQATTPRVSRPTFLTDYSNLSGPPHDSPARARTVASFDPPLPLPFPLPPGGGPPSRPTTVGSSQRSRYTSATGDTVYVNVDELSSREARDLLVERLRAQALEFPYPTPAKAATVTFATSTTPAGAIAEGWPTRPNTRDLQSLRPPPRSSAVANACQLLGLYHAAMTAPKPAQPSAGPRVESGGGGGPSDHAATTEAGFRGAAATAFAPAAFAAAAAGGNDDRTGGDPESIRDRRASMMGHEKKSVKFKDVAK